MSYRVKILWGIQAETECDDCEGSGVISGDISAGTGLTPDATCATCSGTGNTKPESEPIEYSFQTEAELSAFLDGVEAACGWMEYTLEESPETENLFEETKEETSTS